MSVAETAQQRHQVPPDFDQIYDSEFQYVWNFLIRMGVPRRDLRDKVHDVFEALYRCRDKYDPSRPIRPWLTGIAFRVASNLRRSASFRREVYREEVTVPSGVLDPEIMVQKMQLRALLTRGLDRLDQDYRAVIVLHDLEGYTIPVIAEMLEVNTSTMYSRLRQGRQLLAKAISQIRAQKGGA